MQQQDEQMKRLPWNMAFLEVLQQDYDCLSSKNKSVLMLLLLLFCQISRQSCRKLDPVCQTNWVNIILGLIAFGYVCVHVYLRESTAPFF